MSIAGAVGLPPNGICTHRESSESAILLAESSRLPASTAAFSKMGFLSICTALYDYKAQAEGELEIREGELLYILEKGADDWWRAKKRAAIDEDEPVGLVPYNYVSEVSVRKS